MRKISDKIRVPKGIRTNSMTTTSKQSFLIGRALRRAKMNLFIKRIVYLMISILFCATIAFLFLGGYFDRLIEYVINKAL